MSSLSVRNVRKVFGTVEVLKDIDLEIGSGEFLILVGPSGCGKSTLLNIIAGLDTATSGDILIGERMVNNLSPKDRDIAMVFQSYALYPNMTVRKNISFGLEMRRVPKAEQEKIVERVAKILQMGQLLDRKPSQLSGGQRQRVAMGRAIARDPQLFLFDEPLSNLDAKLRVEMRTEIKLLHNRLKATIVYVTHDQIEAMTLGSKIAVMQGGEIRQFGSPQEIYDRPADLFVAGFIGSPSMNFIKAQATEDSGGVGAGVLTLTSGNLLATGSGNAVSAPLDLTGTALSVGGPGDVTISGGISGSNSLFKQGEGTLTLQSPLSSITRTVFAGGVIALGNNGVIGSGAVDAYFQSGEIRNASGAPFALAVNLTLYGAMKVGGAQDINFTGTVGLGYATREINVTNTGATTLSGVISSSQTLINYGLTKTGPGRLVLANAANTYDGETTVSEGDLRVTGSIAASTLTTVRGGTLSGTGTVGKLTLQSGVLAPGTSAGTLNCGDLLFSGGLFAVEIASAISADKMNVTGSAGLGANTELGLIPLALFDPQIGDTWVIVDNDGTDAFAAGPYRFTHDGVPIEAGTPFAAGGKNYMLNYNGGTGNDVMLTATVPEPGTAALMAAALPLLIRRRRR